MHMYIGTARHGTAKDERQVQPRAPAVGDPVALLGGARLALVEPGAARGSVAHLRQTGERGLTKQKARRWWPATDTA